MSSITTKALLHFEQSQSLERQECDQLQEAVQSLTNESNDAVTNTVSSAQTTVPFELIQSLDTRLCDHVAKKDYDNALQVALAMQKCMPKSYYGYQRAAQIHLILGESEKACEMYRRGLNTVEKCGHALLRKSAEDAMDIFNQATIELANNGRFKNAHDLASWITWLLPSSPTGYLHTGEIFEMQGKYSIAEEVYYRGVSKVVSVAPKNLDSLVQHLVNVKREIKRNPRCDFIIQLPLEVASDTLRYLSSYELLKCMGVSRNWKERILKCSTAWRVVTLNTQKDQLDLDTIQHIKRFVQRFIFVNIPESLYALDALLTSIADGEFENLVDIEWDTMNGVVGICHIPIFTRIFETVKLTSLSINVEVAEADTPTVSLEQVLKCLPNLKRLSYYLWEERWLAVDDNFAQHQEPTEITDLRLCWICEKQIDSVANDYFVPLIPLFPNLVHLYITYCEPGSLPTITQNLPKLRHLYLNEEEYYNRFETICVRDSTLDGLQSIQICGVLDPKDVFDTITKYSSTLEYISVDLHKTGKWCDSAAQINTNWNWKSVQDSKINAPVLRTLYMYANYFWPFENLVGDCPMLKDAVTLEYNEDESDDDMW